MIDEVFHLEKFGKLQVPTATPDADVFFSLQFYEINYSSDGDD